MSDYLPALVTFWRSFRKIIFDIEPEDGQELAEQAGLFRYVEYNPKVHGECECDLGDMIYEDIFKIPDLPPSPVIVPAALLIEAAEALERSSGDPYCDTSDPELAGRLRAASVTGKEAEG